MVKLGKAHQTVRSVCTTSARVLPDQNGDGDRPGRNKSSDRERKNQRICWKIL